MTAVRKTRVRRIALALGVLAALVPVTVSSGGLEPNDACASGTCCFEPGSLCESSGDMIFDHAEFPGECPNVNR